MSRTTTLHVMAPPLETLLMNRCGIKYSLARSIVADGRAILGMSKNEAWTPELEEECTCIYEARFGSIGRKPPFCPVDTNLTLDETLDDSFVHEGDRTVDTESSQNEDEAASHENTEACTESDYDSDESDPLGTIDRHFAEFLMENDSNEEMPLIYHEITKEGTVAIICKRETPEGTVKVIMNEPLTAEGDIETSSTDKATIAFNNEPSKKAALSTFKKKVKKKNLLGWLKRSKRS